MSRYKAYGEYKDSGVESIGAIPLDWQIWKWKHALTSRMSYGANEAAMDDDRNHPRYIRITDMNADGTLRDDTFKSLTPIVAKDYLLEDGDILVARTGATVGKSFLYKAEFGSSCFAGYLIRARINKRIVDPKFVYWYMQSDQYWKYVSGSQIQATIQNVSAEKYGDMEFAIPNETLHCDKIANFLDHETAKIDTLIAKQQGLIKLLKEKRQAVISHAVTKGLNPNAPMRDSGVEWLGQVPAHWEVLKLKHVIEHLESGVSVNAADVPAEGDEMGVLKTSCVYTRFFRKNENKTVLKEEYLRLKCPVRKGAIIISRMNTPELVGASALVELDCPNIFLPDRLWQTIFNPALDINPKFIAFFMMITGFRSQISIAAEGASSSMQNIAKDDYLSINISLPDVEEQDSIVQLIERKLTILNRLEEQANCAIGFIQERRTALISAAVTGKIDVRDWQPASVPELEDAAA